LRLDANSYVALENVPQDIASHTLVAKLPTLSFSKERTTQNQSSPSQCFSKEMVSHFPKLLAAYDRYLSQATWEVKGEDAIVVVPTTFHAHRIRELETDLSSLLKKRIIGIEARKTEQARAEPLPSLPPPRPQVSFSFPRNPLPVNLVEEERKNRTAIPHLLASPAYAINIEMAKRWAEGVNHGQKSQALWIHGSPGSGKTSLATQMNEWIDLKHRLKVTNVMNFFHEWRKALEEKDHLNFVRRYRREVDVLVLENIDELANKTKTQQEVLFTVNAILDNGGSVVVTSTLHPLQIRDILEPSLYSRLFSGLILEMPKPDRQFKEALWRKLVQDYGLSDYPIDIHIEHQLFNIPVDCARKVNTLFINAIGRFSLKRSIDAHDINDLESLHGSRSPLGGFVGASHRTPNELIDEVARLCGVSRAAVLGKVRRSDIIIARRFVALALMRFSGLTNSSIANILEKDPSTISHSIKSLENDLQSNRHIAEQWNWICEQLGVPFEVSRKNSIL